RPLPGPAPSRTARLAHRAMERDRYWARGEVLLAHERGPRSPPRRNEALVALFVGREQGAHVVAGIGGTHAPNHPPIRPARRRRARRQRRAALSHRDERGGVHRTRHVARGRTTRRRASLW